MQIGLWSIHKSHTMAVKVLSLLLVFFALSTIWEAECIDKVGGCICTKEYRPVCGKNGVTYSNSCLLGCAHVPQACEGECPCKPKYAKAVKRIKPFKSRKTQQIRKLQKPKCTGGKQSPSKGYRRKA